MVVVPLFVDADGVPDFGWMDAATRSIASGLRPGTLVSYETTLPVGTTRDRWAPVLQEGSGLTPGRDFALVFSPERVLTGRVFADLRRYPKLVGGIDEESARRGVVFYESVLDFDVRDDLPRANGVWDMGSSEAAELAKLAETTYRDVNIGLANQFARYAQTLDVDIATVIEACNTQPYSHIHQPGIAVGGHCIPIYPRIYLWNDPAGHRGPIGARGQRLDAGVRDRSACRGVWRPGGCFRAGSRRDLPRRRQGNCVLGGLPDRQGADIARRDRIRLRPHVHRERADRPRSHTARGATRDSGSRPSRPRGVPHARDRRSADGPRAGGRQKGHRPGPVGRRPPDLDRRLTELRQPATSVRAGSSPAPSPVRSR